MDFLFVILFILYFMPTVIAFVAKKKDAFAISILNILLGWTFIGWVWALVWAAKKD
ncbi:superinfection immunity protein [Candidatus Uhrbacteria bacterium]|nr:superinfection immunity protein [Candidatus Uhrbacteria bacterium]